MRFAVLKVKKIDGVRHLSLDVVFDSFSLANDYCKVMNENSSVRVSYYFQPVSSCPDVFDHDLIKRCMNVANCLYLAEVFLMKNGSRSLARSKYWFNLAKSRSKLAADLLEIM